MPDGNHACVLLLTALGQGLVAVGKSEQSAHRRDAAGGPRQLLKILRPGAELSRGPGENRPILPQF
jgi:hypothetical protein